MDKSKEAVKVYNKIAKEYEREFKEPSEHIDEFLSLISKRETILDVGCGIGVDTKYMESKGFKIIGIDLSKDMLRLAKEKFPEIDFRLADMRKLDFKPEYFGGIFIAYSLIHLPKKDILGTLKQLHKFLKPNGIIYFAVHEGKSEEIFLEEPLKKSEKTFLNIFSYEEITQLIRKVGFSIINKYRREPNKKEEFDFVKLFILAKK